MANPSTIFVLGGHQTDFARNWSREGLGLGDIVTETAQEALADAAVTGADVEVGHVGNFIGELTSSQGHLGGLLVEADKAFAGVPMSRHEAACASGSMAVLAAMADIGAGRYDCALVVGVEEMRSRPGESVRHLASGARVPEETDGVEYAWPRLFGRIAEEYDHRYGLDRNHLAALARSNFENARRNPNAQTRNWELAEDAFGTDDAANPVVDGWIRKQDCSQVTDGGAGVVLAGPRFAADWARRNGADLTRIPRITGWGHTSGRMTLIDKLADSRADELVFPHVRRAITDSLTRAGIEDVWELDTIEVHDCFTPTHYLAIDHFGITPPGQSFRALEDGTVLQGGTLPINPSGGLMGGGHPVGATGARMLLDASRQVSGRAGDYQVDGARRAATLNVGGSTTTVASFVVETAEPYWQETPGERAGDST